MRFELAGTLLIPEPLILRFVPSVGEIPELGFHTPTYIEMGYTHFDVICIGGAGGGGGGIRTEWTGTYVRSYGGSGGGGGFMRVHGLLSALPDDCPVHAGHGGLEGMSHLSDAALTTDGEDGEASYFNDTTCRASGGKGGKRVQYNDTTHNPLANGGEGGVGNRTIAGGGADGGLSGTPTPTGPGTPGSPGKDGTLFQNIGEGGGGGAGGVGLYKATGGRPGTLCVAATAGGRGAYNPGDTSVYGPGTPPSDDLDSGAPNIVYGCASGAKAAPLNGLPTIFGQSALRAPGGGGIVIVRLTARS